MVVGAVVCSVCSAVVASPSPVSAVRMQASIWSSSSVLSQLWAGRLPPAFAPLFALRNHAYSNILKILQPKKGKFLDNKNQIFFIFLLKT